MRLKLTYYAIIILALLLPSGCEEPPAEAIQVQPEAVPPEERNTIFEDDTLAAGLRSSVPPGCPIPDDRHLRTRPLVDGHRFENPVFVAQPPGEGNTLYVVERAGRILMVADGRVLRRPFLDIRRMLVSDAPDQGLLGLEFHPRYRENKRFYLYYTPGGEPRNVVAEWAVSIGEPVEQHRLIEPIDPADGNNGGMLAFGPDGYLYVGMGDGGGAGDPHGYFGNAQDAGSVFGSLLRIDVDARANGFAPTGNPYVEKVGHPLVWAKGLRNPWRFSFDRATGRLYVGDEGQSRFEEITVVPKYSDSWLNFGWRAYEGFSVYDDDLTDMFDRHLEPAITYETRSRVAVIRHGCAVVGGYVYRGERAPSLRGVYVYGDRCSSDVAAFSYCDGKVHGHTRLASLSAQGDGLTSFGTDNADNLYMLFSDGQVRKVVED
jgi:glucose/arabinose dehydrogenase